MARGGSRGTKGGGVSVNPSTTNIRNSRYGGGFGGFGSPLGGGFGHQAPQPQVQVELQQPALPTGIVAGGPCPYGRGNDLGSSSARIINDMRKANMSGYQGLPQEQFQRPSIPFRSQIQPFQPQPFQNRFGSPVYSAPYQPQPMPFRAPFPGKGGSKGGGMSVPRNQFQPMPMMENPLGNRGMMRTMEMKPGRDYIPFMPPARQRLRGMQQQAALQGLGGFFR